ncbi:MAG: germination protein YpeB [Ruminococcus sp.]|nr:germination protein YpeB [Ruminococcus sp.]
MRKRTLIRIFSITAATAAVMAVNGMILSKRSAQASLSLQNSYLRALEELSTAADNISNTLQKELYAGTADMHQKLSQQLWRDSSTAKAALAQLPVSGAELENTYKFLSQVGNYSLAMSEKVREGEQITDEEYENLASLYDFSLKLRDGMWSLENSVAGGEISISDALGKQDEDLDAPTVTDGFEDFEEGFDSYPTLIYDGPFSDHILEKKPLLLEGEREISREMAHERAGFALGVDLGDIDLIGEEEGKMPSYLFSDEAGTATCSITKQGGYISYFLKSRQVMTSSISEEDALAAADKILEDRGYTSMGRTYYENTANIMTVNYAFYADDICCYTDLIKVSVAMDNGEVLGLDCRGYLVNHTRRQFPKDRKSVLDVQQQLSPKLTLLSRGLAVIPSDSQEELLCYEFKCEAPDGTHVIVYFNVVTGKEEQILILFESESGTLTM